MRKSKKEILRSPMNWNYIIKSLISAKRKIEYNSRNSKCHPERIKSK
jgi:hypothetical protein